MTTASKVLAIAAGEIGYSRWTDPKRGTKYARETQPALWPRDTWLLANGIAFCDIFVTWVFWKAGALDILPGRQSYNTDYRASQGRAAGALVSRAQARPGDVLVFDWNRATAATNHVGILEKVTAAGNPQSIEGNTSPGSSGSQGNGGGVYRRVRRWSQVRYIIRPQWAKARGSSSSTPASSSSAFADVDKTQTWLAQLGFDVGPVDGIYGTKTAAATKAAQKALGITPVDGRPGPTTRTHLEAAVTTLDKISKDIATIKRALEPGIAGKRTDGELASFIRKQIRPVARSLQPGIAGERTDGEAISAMRRFRNDVIARVAAAQAAVLEAVQETGKAQGLTDEQVQAIATAAAEASARVSAEDVAGLLEVGVRDEG